MADRAAGWLVEEGIAEHRAVRTEKGRIVAARLQWPGRLCAGSTVEARLIARAAGSTRGTARSESGEEILLDRLPRDVSEGALLRVAVTRAAFAGPGRLKRAQGRPTEAPPCDCSLVESLRAAGNHAEIVRRFPPGTDWDALIAEAFAGQIDIPGGALLIAPTAAMTTVDVDGPLAPHMLALAAVPALAQSLRRFDITGSVAVDFPTLADKADRRAVDSALGTALADWPHERTAMNGFGLVQIVAKSERPSLLQLAQWQGPDLAWRALLRRAEGLEGAGMIELAIHPALTAATKPAHLAELERRSGRRVRVREDAGLAIEAPHAQLVLDA